MAVARYFSEGEHLFTRASALQIDAKKDAIRGAKKDLKDAKSDYKARRSETAKTLATFFIWDFQNSLALSNSCILIGAMMGLI